MKRLNLKCKMTMYVCQQKEETKILTRNWRHQNQEGKCKYLDSGCLSMSPALNNPQSTPKSKSALTLRTVPFRTHA